VSIVLRRALLLTEENSTVVSLVHMNTRRSDDAIQESLRRRSDNNYPGIDRCGIGQWANRAAASGSAPVAKTKRSELMVPQLVSTPARRPAIRLLAFHQGAAGKSAGQ